MSCDLRDPNINAAYADIATSFKIDWMMLGYRDTRDKLFLYGVGTEGLDEMKVQMPPDEPLFGLLRLEGKLLLWSYLPEQSLTGVRRARALVHSRAVGSTFRNDASLTVAKLSSLTISAVRHKLKLDGLGSLPPSPQPPQTPQFANYSNGGVVPSVDALRISNSPPLTPNSPQTQSRRPSATLPTSNSNPASPTPDSGSPFVAIRKGSNPSARIPPPAYPPASQDVVPPKSPPPRATTSSPTHSANSNSSVDKITSRGGVGAVVPLAEINPPEERVGGEERRAREAQEKEDLAKLENDKREREVAELARVAAEKEARDKWESEQRERERLDYEERMQLEKEEEERREAADRLRREEARRAEEKQRAEEERLKKEEAERLKAEKEDLRLMLERERLVKKLRDEAETAKKVEARQAEQMALRKKFEKLHASGEVMLSGLVTVQGGQSLFWKRRYFELDRDSLKLFKSEKDKGAPLDTLPLTHRVKAIIENPEESAIAHSFKIAFRDQDEDEAYLFYTDEKDDKELLLAGLRMSARL